MFRTDVEHGSAAEVGSARPHTAWRYPAVALGVVFAAYLVGRGIVELFQIDYSDPASYQNAWGGPHLSGVVAVHTGPGLAIVVATVVIVMRRHRSRSSGLTVVRRPPRQPNTH